MDKDNNLYVVYGSESDLTKNYPLEKPKDTFIRIYNKTKPNKSNNCVDVKLDGEFYSTFTDLSSTRKFKNIIFIGAATVPFNNNLLISLSREQIEAAIATNLSNYINLAYFLLPFMMRIKSGNFIFISSFSSQHTTKGSSLYSASKAFCEVFFEVIGKEYGSRGIKTLSIRLGCFEGKLFDKLDDSHQQKYLNSISLRRL